MSSKLSAVSKASGPATDPSLWERAGTGYVPLITEVNAAAGVLVGALFIGLGVTCKVINFATCQKEQPQLYALSSDGWIEVGGRTIIALAPRMLPLPAACLAAMKTWRMIYPN